MYTAPWGVIAQEYLSNPGGVTLYAAEYTSLRCDLLQRLLQHGHAVWLCGGWAEELWQICPPRAQRDSDLLYQAADFTRLDAYLSQQPDLASIPAKTFSHKRTILAEGVMVELLLVTQEASSFTTSFFDGIYHFAWPDDTFQYQQTIGTPPIPLASRAALGHYRAQHTAVEQAYQDYRRHLTGT